jgi:DNA-binding NarL/FixJ family response regulator
MTEEPARVVLLEDDADTRDFFAACVTSNSQLKLAGAFATLSAATAWFADNQADVLLTDLALPDGHGLSLIHYVATHQPGCHILVVSVFGDEETVLSCIEAGAVGYIHKDSKREDVAQSILDVRRGASPISPMIARKLLERLRRAPDAAPAPLAGTTEEILSPKESAILELIARGYSYAEIARLQNISLHTVQSHIRNLYSKLAVHSRSEAVFEATRLGLLTSMKAGA